VARPLDALLSQDRAEPAVSVALDRRLVEPARRVVRTEARLGDLLGDVGLDLLTAAVDVLVVERGHRGPAHRAALLPLISVGGEPHAGAPVLVARAAPPGRHDLAAGHGHDL